MRQEVDLAVLTLASSSCKTVVLFLRQEVDLAVSTLVPMIQRVDVADWSTIPYDYWYNGLAFRLPPRGDHMWTAFLWPFVWQVGHAQTHTGTD